MLLTSAAFVHLKEGDFSKHTRNLSPASRTILLSGPAGELLEPSCSVGFSSFVHIQAAYVSVVSLILF